MNSYAFWAYDTFPYVLGAEIHPNIEVKNGEAKAYCPSYGGYVKVRHQMGLEDGEKVKLSLEHLEAVYKAECKKLQDKFVQNALRLAPFLKDFPAYKKG